ncbi:MAG: permease for cytosine/purines, uracil, thiamine, allantoin-domain-containing protein [Monoraphidium minutum]|nr:MAG: permease for cytosine/purines, uracil, thiamine, allantoin-domain-containing protein [Monoraphidium minutum]
MKCAAGHERSDGASTALAARGLRPAPPQRAAPDGRRAPRRAARHERGARSRRAAPVQAARWFDEPIEPRMPAAPAAELINDDLAPTLAAQRTLGAADMALLWVALVVSTTTLMLAGSLVELGMSWSQGVLTVFVGNLVTLVPLVLNAYPGTKYGIPFPVLCRAAFGIKGANLPALSRALVACGWFGINTTIGGNSIFQMLQAVTGGGFAAPPLPGLGISGPELACFGFFWAVQVAIITRGIASIKAIEKYSAPVLVALALALLAWALTAAGGPGPMLSAPSRLAGPGAFARAFVPAVTAQVGYWATLALNIPDFSRYATSQRAQLLGQAWGLPPCMAAFSFVGLAVTSASAVIYGSPIVDPVELLGRMRAPAAICVSLFGLILATLTTNIAANVVGPANAIVNLAPRRITFAAGGVITAALGAAIMPWKLLSSASSFVGWLVAYSSLLGPVIGVLIADFWAVRARRLDVDGLYCSDAGGPYWYRGGWNPAAVAAVAAGVAPCLPGMAAALGLSAAPAAPAFAAIYDAAWFVGAGVAAATYCLLMRGAAGAAAERGGGGGGAAAAPA